MNKLLISSFLCILFPQSKIDTWLNNYKSIFNSEYKTIYFISKNYSEENQVFETNKNQCKLMLGSDNQFRFEIGNKIIISNGKNWKSYDTRTNQLFIYDIDSNIEKLIKIFQDISKIQNFTSKIIIEDEKYYLFTPYFKNPLLINFSKDGKLDSIILNDKVMISEIKIIKSESLNLLINQKNIIEFDLRSND